MPIPYFCIIFRSQHHGQDHRDARGGGSGKCQPRGWASTEPSAPIRSPSCQHPAAITLAKREQMLSDSSGLSLSPLIRHLAGLEVAPMRPAALVRRCKLKSSVSLVSLSHRTPGSATILDACPLASCVALRTRSLSVPIRAPIPGLCTLHRPRMPFAASFLHGFPSCQIATESPPRFPTLIAIAPSSSPNTCTKLNNYFFSTHHKSRHPHHHSPIR